MEIEQHREMERERYGDRVIQRRIGIDEYRERERVLTMSIRHRNISMTLTSDVGGPALLRG